MSTFQIPQFIEQKPKIVGPLTLIEFAYLAAAGGISLIAFYVFNFFFWIMITVIMGGLAVGLAFGKINGQPMPQVIQAAFTFWLKPRTYTWQRATLQTSLEIPDFEKIEELRRNMSFQDKIKSAALGIATGKIFSKFSAPNEKHETYQAVTFLTGERKMAKKVDY